MVVRDLYECEGGERRGLAMSTESVRCGYLGGDEGCK